MNPLYKFYLGLTGDVYTGNEEDTLPGYYLDPSDGSLQQISGFYTSGKILVDKDLPMLIRNVKSSQVFVVYAYGANDNPLGGQIMNVTNSFFGIPKAAAYVRCCVDSLYISSIDLFACRLSYPVYADDLSMDYEQETGQRFYRKKLSGKLTFVRDDFDAIMARPFETEYNFVIMCSEDGGTTWARYFDGHFFQTDCNLDIDNKKLQVQPEPLDEYTEVLAGLDKEFNLIELTPQIERLTIRKRPMTQVYRAGDSVISNFIGGTYWEQDVNKSESNENKLKVDYYFSLASRLVSVEVTAKAGAPASYAGTYVGKVISVDDSSDVIEKGTFYNFERTYRIEYTKYKEGEHLGTEQFWFKDAAGNELYFFFDSKQIGTKTISLEAHGSSTGSLQLDITLTPIYMRYLCDVDKVGTVETYPIPSDDIVSNNRNYKRVVGYAVDLTEISAGKSIEPTQWGRMDDGAYFLPPAASAGQTYYPIAQSYWGNSSYWYAFHLLDWVLDQKAQKEYTLNDTYPISSCIEVLLKKIAPNITHMANSNYSQFLYSSNNPISGLSFSLLISQKSNILNGEYQTPAQKAPITLGQLLDMLKNCFKCYWYIEDNRLKIEHVNFFRNGGSYYNKPAVSLDLTQMEYTRSGKKWAFSTSKYSFDKVDMPQRYQFAWMDEVTTPFTGLPIEIRSKYVTAEKVEDVNVSEFTSDIDYMLLNPSAISQDGFAVFAATKPVGGGQYELPFVQITIDKISYHLQNGYMAFASLQEKYWKYDMPAKLITVNNVQTSSVNVERKKKQQFNCPVPLSINPLLLIKTDLGRGTIEKLSVNLCSLMSKTTLKYDTE